MIQYDIILIFSFSFGSLVMHKRDNLGPAISWES